MKKKQDKSTEGKQTVNREDNEQKDEVMNDGAHENRKTQAPNNIDDQEEKVNLVPDNAKKEVRKKKVKTMPKKKSSVVFKPSLKKNKKNMSKAVTRNKPNALDTVIEDSLKESGGILGTTKRRILRTIRRRLLRFVLIPLRRSMRTILKKQGIATTTKERETNT